MHVLASLIGVGVAFLALPELVSAQVGALPNIVIDVISRVPWLSSNLPTPSINCSVVLGGGVGACYIASLFVYAVRQGWLLIGILAFITIMIAAFNLVIRQSEEAMTSARRTVQGVVLGLFLVFTSERFVDALYGGGAIAPGEVFSSPGNVSVGAFIISEEVLGIVRWGETLVAIVAIGLLVVQGVSVLMSFGSEQTIQKAYKAVTSTALGLLLLVFDRSIAAIFGYNQLAAFPGAPDATIFIVEVFGLVRLVLGFIGIVALAVIIYAGILMLTNFGNEELVTKAKTIILNTVIGIVLIVTAFVLVNFVILGLT